MRINRKNNLVDASGRIIKHLQDPKEQDDAFNKQYIQQIPNSTTESGCCVSKNNRLIYIVKPKSDGNAINYKIIIIITK